MRNRLIYQSGLVAAVLMIVFTVLLILERISQIEAVRSGFWDNLAYTTSQADFEIARLTNTLLRSRSGLPIEQTDDVFIRYEVALGRLVGLSEGRTGQRILGNEGVRDAVLSITATIENLEADILGFSGLSSMRQDEVITSLQQLSDEFHLATVTIASTGDQDQTEFYESLAAAARFEIFMLLLIASAGVLAYFNVYLERRRFVSLNKSLADTVSERTSDLQETNDRLQAEVIERSQAEQKYRSLVDHATEAIVIMDVGQGTFMEANPRAEALFGLPREKLIGHFGPLDLSPEFQPDGRPSRATAMEYINDALDGDFPSFEWVHRSIDGTEVICSVSLARFPDPSRRLVRGSLIDLTEKKAAEASQLELERQLSQSQKLETIGQMTGGVAHDFNNLLSVVLGNLELLEDLVNDLDQRELIGAAKGASMRGATLTRSMLNFARRANLKPQKVLLDEIVDGIGSWMARTIPATITVNTSIKSDLWPVVADISGTESAILNLVVNAQDAMPDGGHLVIEMENVEIDETDPKVGLNPGQYVMLAVSDTGAGISQDNISRIFEPFFTTKSLSTNSGLGLSMVYGFMSQSGGDIRVYSEIGVGSTIKLFFPVQDASQQNTLGSDKPEVEIVVSRNARILLAEDQEDVLAVLKRSLEAVGHEVIPARNGDEAARLVDKSESIDLLITDVVMPGKLQGPGLAKHLRGRLPGLPVIFLSGYASEATLHGNGLREEDVRLMKPVSRSKLISAVNGALSD